MSNGSKNKASKAPEATLEAMAGFVPNMDAANEAFAPVVEQMRATAEQTMAQAKDAYEKSRVSMEETQQSVEAAMGVSQEAGKNFAKTAFDMSRSVFEAQSSYLEQLLGAKSASEIFEIQSTAMRAQTELAVKNMTELQEAAKTAVEGSTKPFAEMTEKAFSQKK